MSFNGEKIYHSNLPVKYVLESNNEYSSKLIVIFSSFNNPIEENQHVYNYMKTLKNIKCNKLFILDSYGPRGCYYLGENMTFEFETSVISLLTYVASKLGVNFTDIILCGSSKGGTAALYFGLKYNISRIITGCPQVYIADYILANCTKTSKYIMNDIENSNHINKLNNLIFNQLNKEINSQIYLFSSENDEQYTKHIKSFLNKVEKINLNIRFTINNSMKNHNEIDQYFPDYLKRTLIKMIYNIEIKDIEIKKNKESAKISINYINQNKSNNIYFKFIITNIDGMKNIIENIEGILDLRVSGVTSLSLDIQVYVNNNVIYDKYLGRLLFGVDLL